MWQADYVHNEQLYHRLGDKIYQDGICGHICWEEAQPIRHTATNHNINYYIKAATFIKK